MCTFGVCTMHMLLKWQSDSEAVNANKMWMKMSNYDHSKCKCDTFNMILQYRVINERNFLCIYSWLERACLCDAPQTGPALCGALF